MRMGFFEDNILLSQWWRRKLASLGYKSKPYNQYKGEGGCILCGRHERVFPLSGRITLCGHCLEKAKTAQEAFGTRLYYESHVALNISEQVVCDACGTHVKTGRPYYVVYDGRICTKCTWKKLGGHSSVMKVWGERMW